MKKYLLIALLALPAYFGSAQSAVSKPSGTTITSASGTSSQWARNGGDVFTVRNTSWSTYHNCIYWGYPLTLSSVIDGHNQNGCSSGLSNMSYSSGASNLSGGIIVFTGTTNYYWVFYGTYTLATRLTVTLTDTLGNPLNVTNTGSLLLMKITKNFKVKYQLEAQNPFAGYAYQGAINVYDSPNNSDGASAICTSISHNDKFYQVTTTATATNTGPYCSGQTANLSSSGGLTASDYLWTMTGSGASFANTANISFTTSGSADKRMKVEVTGVQGCKDSAITVVKMMDTAVEADVKGSNISIPSGSVSPAVANATDFGIIAVGASMTTTFKIFNYGNQGLKVSSVSSSGAPFAISAITTPKTISPHDSATFDVVFNPTSSGAFSATITINNADCDEGTYTFVVAGTGGTCDTTKEIDLRGNYNGIVKGSTTASLANSTDFGNIVENATASKTFKVFNTGTTSLVLNSLSITGGDFAIFSYSGISFPLTLNGGDSTTFSITCSPTSLGVKTTTITLGNSDCDEFSYDFVVKATDICNTAREIDVLGNGNSIPKGTSSTSGSNNTDYGSTILGGSLTNPFTISNTGTATLTVTGISVTGADASMFTVNGITFPKVINGGTTASFNVKFSPTAVGSRNAAITIISNDCDEGSYDFAVKGASSSVTVTPIPKPTGTTITPASADTRAWAMGSGSYHTIRNSAWKTYTECTYWGYHDTIAGVINGYNPSATCSGLSDMYYSSGLSNLSAGKLVFTGSTTYYYLNTSGFFSSSSVPVRLTFNITDTLGNALPLIRSGSISLLKVTKNYKVALFLEALGPTNGFGYSGGFYTGAIDLFNNLHTDASSLICTSISTDQFYSVTTTATATNFGPYCASTPVRIKATGGVSYAWTGPNSFTSGTNDTSFYAYGFPQSSRFKVEATGILGCKDSAATIVTVKDTGTKISLNGNGVAIAKGSTSTSVSNNTNFGGTSIGVPLAKTFRIKNPGTASLSVTAINITGVNPSMFVASGLTLPVSINAADSASFVVTFTPTSSGSKSAIITVTNNSCSNGLYDFKVEGSTVNCDSTNPIARTPGMHVSKNVQTSPGGWTCYCDSLGKLLLALKLGGTGAVIPDTGVTMKIQSTLAVHHPKNTGFIKSDNGFVVWNRTWDVKPSTQPTSKVPVRYFYAQDMVDSVNQVLISNAQTALPSNDSIYFWKVTNTSLGAHPPVSSIFLPDMKLIQGGKGIITDTTWVGGNFGTNYFAQFLVSGFSGGGGGGGNAGLTPLPLNILKLSVVQKMRNVELTWRVEENANIAGFNVMRSRNGVLFENIAFVPANAVGGQDITYSFTDKNYHNDGKYYYRIIQVNLNASMVRSNVVSLNFDQQTASRLEVWPNPFSNAVNFAFENSDRLPYQLEIVDQHGRKITALSAGTPWMQTDLGWLNSGIYQVLLRDERGNIIGNSRVIKN